jgi:hypothetical protein
MAMSGGEIAMAESKPGPPPDDDVLPERTDLSLWEESRRGQVIVDPGAPLLTEADVEPYENQAAAIHRDAASEELPPSGATPTS